MAKIPLLNLSGGVNPNAQAAPTQSIAQAGIVNAANAKLGSTIKNIGLDLIKRRTQSETAAYRSEANADFAMASVSKKKELYQKYSQEGKGFEGYTKELNDWTSDWGSERKKLAPNNIALESFSNTFNTASARESIKADALENTQKAAYHSGLLDKQMDTSFDVNFNDPDVLEATDRLNVLKSEISSTAELHIGNNPGLLKTKLQRATTIAREGVVQGLISNSLKGVVPSGGTDQQKMKAITDFVNGTGQTKGIMEGATPSQKASITRRFVSVLKTEETMERKEANVLANDLISAYNANPNNVVGLVNMEDKTVAAVNKISDPALKKVLTDRLDVAKVIYEETKDLHGLSQKDFEEETEFFGKIKVDASSPMAAKVNRGLLKVKKKILTERNNDPKGYVDRNNPGLTDKESYEKQLAMGLDAKYLDKNEAITIGQSLIETLSTKDAGLRMQEFKIRYGKDSKVALAQIVRENKNVPEAMMLALDMDNKHNVESLLNTLKNEKIIEEGFIGESFDKTEINEEVDALSDNMSQVYMLGGQAETTNNLKRIVTIRAKAHYSNSNSSGYKDSERSAKLAYEEIIDGSSAFVVDKVEGEGGTGGYSLAVPKNMMKNIDLDDVQEFAENARSTDNMKKNGVVVPVEAMLEGITEDDFFDLAEKNVMMVNSSDGKGMVYRYIPRDKKRKQIANSIILKDKNGLDIVIPFEAMTK